MDCAKPENIEKPFAVTKQEVEKAETKLRSFERNNIEASTQQELTIKDLQPNTTYEKNGYTYQTDGMACPVKVSGYLHLEKASRTPQQTKIGKLGEPSDEGGHIIGAQFDGPTDAFNIRPQDKALNHGAYGKLENEWAEALKEGKTVKVETELRYADSTIRPDRYIIKYWIDDVQKTIRLKNQSV